MKLLLVLLSVAVLPAPSVAQDATALLHDDVRFAENLARFHFFPLAFEVLDGLESQPLVGQDQDLEGSVAFTRARIQIRVSKSTADPAQRLEYQGRAIEALGDWARAGTPLAYHARRPDALEDLARTLVDRGKLLAQQAREADDDGVAKDRSAAAVADFRRSLEVLTALQRELEDRAQQLEDMERADEAAALAGRALDSRLLAGLTYLEWSEVTTNAEHERRLDQAIEALVDFQWELEEEGTLPQYVAMYHQARALRRLDQIDEAVEVLEQVIDELDNYFLSQFDAYLPGARLLIAQVLDEAHLELARIHVGGGETDRAQALMDDMRERHERVDQPLGRAGHAVLLSWAEILQGAGRASGAASIAKQVAEDGAGTPEGDRASQMLADPALLAELGSNQAGQDRASPGVLLAAAKGFILDQKYHDAVHYYEVAIAALHSEQDRATFELPAWMDLGRALQWDKRTLEAALAFEHVVDLLQGRADLDEELRNRAALKMYYNFQRRHKETGHSFDKQLRDAARDRLAGMGIRALQFDKALEVFQLAEGTGQPKDFLEALDEFEAVDEGSANFERALVYRARCRAGAGQLDEALAIFDDMLARTEDSALDPTDPKARTNREIALANAVLYKARLLLDERIDRPSEALELMVRFEEKVPGRVGHHELVQYQRLLAHAALGDVEAATAALGRLESKFPDSTHISASAFRLATALDDAARKAEERGDDTSLRRRAADAMWKHCETAGFPSFTNLLRAGDWYARSGAVTDAERCYRTCLERFGTTETEQHLDDARIGLGTVLNAQFEFGKARTLWKDLVRRYPRSTQVLLETARCFGGWVAEDASGNVTEVPGSGDYQDAYAVWVDLFKGVRKESKYHRIWWEAKLGLIYTLYRQGPANPKRMADARKLLNNLKNLTPNYDEDTVESLDPEHRFEERFQRRFRYLDRRIP